MIFRTRFAVFFLCLFFAGRAAADMPSGNDKGEDSRTHLLLIVFENGAPAPGVDLVVDDTAIAATGSDGAIEALIPGGRQRLSLVRDGQVLGRLELVTESPVVQILATVPGPGQAMVFDVEGGGAGAAAAPAPATAAVSGIVAGKVVSAESNQPVRGAQLYFSGLTLRSTTDADGVYQVEIPAGTYQLSVVHPDFATQTLDGIAVSEKGEAVHDIALSPAGVLLSDYVITAPHIEGSVASMIEEQRESSGVTEVLGAEQMARSGDSSAADALKRVTGLLIEDGKYVVIRGQPSRYTQTLWNGSPLPSPDPIRRIVPLDLFPTGVLASIEVEKSYDAEAPGSFGGGLIRLETVGVPDDDFLAVSGKVGGNSITTWKPGLDYEGGSTDILGYDDGTRALPPGLDPDASRKQVEEAAGGFSDIWGVGENTPGVDTGLGLSLGKRVRLLGGNWGLLAAGSWDRSFTRTEEIQRDYALGGEGALVLRNDQVRTRSDMDVDTGGLLVGAAEWERHKFRSNTFFIRKSTKRSELREGTRVVSDDLYINDYTLEWTERSLFAEQLTGEHDFGPFMLAWRGMTAQSSSDSPDQRRYIYRRNSEGDFLFFNQAKAIRKYVSSRDDILSFDADLRVPVLERPRWKAEAFGGVSLYSQDRESNTRRFSFETKGEPDLAQAPDDLLDPSTLGETLVVKDQTQTNDNYLGDASVRGFYLKGDVDWAEQVRLTFGARQESADFRVRTFVAGGRKGGKEVEGGFEDSDVLPFAAVTWRFLDSMQLRASGARTLSRPILNELSPARYFDPDSGDEYLGNPELRPAVIDGYDMRWEWYPSNRESISAGLFRKDYTDPIEQTFVGVGGSTFLRQVQNAAGAYVNGLELAVRADLARLTSPFGLSEGWAKRVYLAANAAFVKSEVELANQNLATSARRPLQGQADTMYNFQLGYDGERHDADLSWNRVGERLYLAGVQGQPDVYQTPASQLDFTYAFALSPDIGLKAKAGNLLDPELVFTQGGEIFRSYRKGRDFSLSIGYRL